MKFAKTIICGLMIGLVSIGCSSDLSRRSEQSIQWQILRDTPLGSTHAMVLGYAEKRGWSVGEQSERYEFPKFASKRAGAEVERVIKAGLGEYEGLPWRMAVVCYWGFDEHGKLMDVFVEKEAEVP